MKTMTEPTSTDDLLVRIVTLDGDDFDEVAELPDDELTEHLSLWDYGDENDGAATINGYVSVSEAERFGAETTTHGGIEYWRAVDHDLRMCSLLRRPLQPLEERLAA
jgi:hypothetical protein